MNETEDAHLGPAHTDDAVGVSAGIIKERDGDRVLAGRNPVAFGGGIDLEHMSSCAEDGLLPARDVSHMTGEKTFLIYYTHRHT